ncbi:hypothetical protein [Sphingomonas sp. R86521]|uniref:hypothetical protein n=1 Tax=Sphingomonas sp. R86521 TaxID=3093860 RepID=UPI0036D358AE
MRSATYAIGLEEGHRHAASLGENPTADVRIWSGLPAVVAAVADSPAASSASSMVIKYGGAEHRYQELPLPSILAETAKRPSVDIKRLRRRLVTKAPPFRNRNDLHYG